MRGTLDFAGREATAELMAAKETAARLEGELAAIRARSW